jgi:MoxR-like ATPase
MSERIDDPFTIYTGAPGISPSSSDKAALEARLQRIRRPIPDDAGGYVADAGLIAAANVALRLGQPLLLTGEAGSGKTRFAASLAAELGLGDELRFFTKSTSTAADLFYTFDTLRRFHDAQLEQKGKELDYVTYGALGKAILLSLDPSAEKVRKWIRPGDAHDRPRRSVVLIDEVDKAPRDFPNDVLNELERLEFQIRELDSGPIKAEPKFAPIVVLTSNSERALPDPFLRRCVYYNIPFPKTAELKRIAETRLRDQIESRVDLLTDALELFNMIRERVPRLRKPPGTGELLGWLSTLNAFAVSEGLDNPLRGTRAQVERACGASFGALLKTAEDQQTAPGVLASWLEKIAPTPTISPR